jgi:hypothetical protein
MRIPLTQRKFAIVDPDDYALYGDYCWCYRADRDHGPGCAARNVRNGKKYRFTYLHREIMGQPEGKEVIFLNHNRLDCRKANLRIVTRQEASWHHRTRKDSQTGIKGVCYNSSSHRWYASIRRHGHYYYLGAFDTKEAASAAYRRAVQLLSQPGQQGEPGREVAQPDRKEGCNRE